MTARAQAVDDWLRAQVRVRVALGERGEHAQVLRFPPMEVVTLAPDIMAPDDCSLDLPEDVARAIYEALADHFGHSGHDTRALRRDYDAERQRVDKFITHLTSGGAR